VSKPAPSTEQKVGRVQPLANPGRLALFFHVPASPVRVKPHGFASNLRIICFLDQQAHWASHNLSTTRQLP